MAKAVAEGVMRIPGVVANIENIKDVTKADLENSLRITNDSLKKVLWSLRFDESRFAESTAAGTISRNGTSSDDAGSKTNRPKTLCK
ncbi:MAG: hypothetical protein ABFS45_26555, partial [Pseudomonadota bacterium]